MSSTWAVAGLVCEIVGVLLLAYFGFPMTVYDRLTEHDFSEVCPSRRFWSWIGTGLVIGGCICQIRSAYVGGG